MKFKRNFSVILLLLLLFCCISAVSAVSDDNSSDVGLSQSEEISPIAADEESNENYVASSQEGPSLKQENNDLLAASAKKVVKSSPSVKKQFIKDIEKNNGTVYLKGNIKISDVIRINQNTVINGKGHTIDARGKTCIFYVDYWASLTLKNIVLKNGKGGLGGAIQSHGDLTVKNCKFINNVAASHGGAINSMGGTLKIIKCKFKGNKVLYEDGGAISCSGEKLIIYKSSFTKNRAYEDGGAIDTCEGVKITIKKSTFTSNTAYKGAGAIWIGVGTKSKISNTKFIKNKASIAGFLYIEGEGTELYKCAFKSNKAAKITSWTVKTKAGGKLNHCGGAIFIIKNTCKVTKCSFIKNKASFVGGAIHLKVGKLKLKGNKFKGNQARYGPKIFKY